MTADDDEPEIYKVPAPVREALDTIAMHQLTRRFDTASMRTAAYRARRREINDADLAADDNAAMVDGATFMFEEAINRMIKRHYDPYPPPEEAPR